MFRNNCCAQITRRGNDDLLEEKRHMVTSPDVLSSAFEDETFLVELLTKQIGFQARLKD